MQERVHNFSAGPATLPVPVLEQVRDELLAYPGAGASVMEISHRSKQFLDILARTKQNIKQLLALPDNYHVLFLPGGATQQFAMVPMNLAKGKTPAFVHTGSWASKAIKEADKFGPTEVVWNGKADGFKNIPRPTDVQVRPDAAYLHFTSNETIEGTEFFEEPSAGDAPLVCDSSSDFLSRPIDVTKYGLIYAGAQKNVGPAGMAVVILRDDLLARVPEKLPSIMDYKLMVENDSLYNTPPAFTIYIVGLVTKWLLETIGGLKKMEKHNIEKAKLLYDVIDQSGGYYRGHAAPDSRSRMNVTFRLPDEAAEKEFVSQATAAGLDGLKGHRSVGGCRASIYNAMPKEGVIALRDFMLEFQRKKG